MTVLSTVLTAYAELTPGFIPEQCNLDGTRFVHDLEWVDFQFDGSIDLTATPSVYITNGGETVTEAISYEVSNYVGSTRTQGTLIAYFDKQRLPLGKDYNVVLKSGSVKSTSIPDCRNDSYETSFSVPSDLGGWTASITPNSIVSEARSMAIFWGFETEPVGEPEFQLLCEGIEVGKYPAYVTWDWNLGQAYAKFGKVMQFEADMHYTLVLPAGSVCTHRDDIVNKEVRLDFIGGYAEPTRQKLTYSNVCILNETDGGIGTVGFCYNMPVEIKEGAKIYLFNEDLSQLKAEAEAWLNTDANCWMVCADFSHIPEEECLGCTFVIPDGIVYSTEDPNITNERGLYQYNKSSGIDGISSYKTEDGTLYDVHGREVRNPVKGGIYVRNGKKEVF